MFLEDVWKGMECVWRLSTNYFRPKNYFEPKIFMAQHFSDTEFFRHQIFQVPNFSDQQIFKQEIGGPKILLTKYFFNLEFFWTLSIWEHDLFLTHKISYIFATLGLHLGFSA